MNWYFYEGTWNKPEDLKHVSKFWYKVLLVVEKIYAYFIQPVITGFIINLIYMLIFIWKLPAGIKLRKKIRQEIKALPASEIAMIDYIKEMTPQFTYKSDPLIGIIDFVNWPIVMYMRMVTGDCDDYAYFVRRLFKYFYKTHKTVYNSSQAFNKQYEGNIVYIGILPQKSIWEMKYGHLVFFLVNEEDFTSYVFSSGAVYEYRSNHLKFDGLSKYMVSHYGKRGAYTSRFNKEYPNSKISYFNCCVWLFLGV